MTGEYTFRVRFLISTIVNLARTDFSKYGGAETLPPKKSSPQLHRTVIPNGDTPFPATKAQDPSDFLWLMTEEPHRSRRIAIQKAHPEVSRRAHLHRPVLFIFFQGRQTHGL